jgi:D-glycero-D-manno-heptose 1,7-bisphosphate phosphatase
MRPFFLDRDGILNRVVLRGSVVSSPRSLAEFQLLPEARPLAQGLAARGFSLWVVTNQPDVSRGLLARSELDHMHALLMQQLPLQGIRVCTAGDDRDPRRKPNPGMLLELAQEHSLDLTAAYFLGDSWKDVLAGQRAGVQTIWLQTEYNRQHSAPADWVVTTLAQVLSLPFDSPTRL